MDLYSECIQRTRRTERTHFRGGFDQELSNGRCSQCRILKDTWGWFEEAMALVILLPFDKDQTSLCTGKDPFGFIVVFEDSVLIILVSIIKITIGLTLGDG